MSPSAPRRHAAAPVLALLAAVLLLSRATAQTEPPQMEPVWHSGGAMHAAALGPAGSTGHEILFSGFGPRVVAHGAAVTSSLEGGRSEPLPGVVQGLAPTEAGLLVAAGRGGLQILDGHLPDSHEDTVWPDVLVKLGELELPGEALDVAALDSLAILARGNDGLSVVDVSDPSAPVLLSTLDLGLGAQAMDLALLGDALALVAAGVTGLHVVDLAEPTAPVEIGRLDRADGFPVQIEAITVHDSNGYACDGPRILVIDLVEPSKPELRATIELPGRTCRALAIQGDRLMALSIDQIDATARLHQLQPIDGAMPTITAEVDLDEAGVPAGLFETPRPRMALAPLYEGGGMVVAGGLGLHTWRWSDPADPASLEIYTNLPAMGLSWPEAVAIDGRRAYVAAGPGGVHDYGLDDPAKPLLKMDGFLPVPGYARDVVARNGQVFVAAESGGIRRFDYDRGRWDEPGAPFDPREVDALESLTAVTRLALAERYLYAADGLAGLRIVATEGEDGMADVGGIDLGFDFPEGLLVDTSRQRLWVASGSAVAAYDIADEAAPALLWRVETPGFARDLDRIGADLLVADDQAGLTVLWGAADLDTTPTEISSHDTPGSAQSVAAWAPDHLAAPGVTLQGGRHRRPGRGLGLSTPADIGYSRVAWVADGEGGVSTFDLDNDLGGPEPGPGFDLPREAVDVTAEGGFVMVAARGSGLWLFHDHFFPPRPWSAYLPRLTQDGGPFGP